MGEESQERRGRREAGEEKEPSPRLSPAGPPGGRMRGLVRRGVLCLLVGLVVAVGVAQALGLLVNHDSVFVHSGIGWDAPEAPASDQSWANVRVHVSDGFGVRRRGWHFIDILRDSHSRRPLPYPDDFSGRWWNLLRAWGPIFAWTPGGDRAWGGLFKTQHLVTESDWLGFRGTDDARGFPALCLWHEIRREGDAYTTPGGVMLSDPSVSAGSVLTVRAVAYRPIWGGLVFNTLFYGMLAFGAAGVWRMQQRDRRFRRGCCPACRYDLRWDFSQGCPECGWGREATKRRSDGATQGGGHHG